MSSFNISASDAMDIVDTYGPDASLWPSDRAADMADRLASDEDFADYVADVARIEAMLENWDEADDGAGIDLADLLAGQDEEDEED